MQTHAHEDFSDQGAWGAFMEDTQERLLYPPDHPLAISRKKLNAEKRKCQKKLNKKQKIKWVSTWPHISWAQCSTTRQLGLSATTHDKNKSVGLKVDYISLWRIMWPPARRVHQLGLFSTTLHVFLSSPHISNSIQLLLSLSQTHYQNCQFISFTIITIHINFYLAPLFYHVIANHVAS